VFAPFELEAEQVPLCLIFVDVQEDCTEMLKKMKLSLLTQYHAFLN
jgi:hypothetical protein